MRALLGAVELCRADIAALVDNYDRSDRRNDGTIIRTEYNLYSVQHNLPLIIVEGDLENPLSDIATEDRLLKCMLLGHTALTEKNHGGRVVFTFRAEKIGSTGVGNTMGVFVYTGSGFAQVEFTDTHPRTDFDGKRMGMVKASIRAATVDTALAAFVHWFWTWHLKRAGCAPPVEIVVVSIDWEEKARLDVAQSTTWQVVKELSPILPGMTPGDFPIGARSDFYGSPLLQLCATAMKIHPLQVIMLQTRELFGGAELAQDTGNILAWMLDAYVKGGPGCQGWDEAMVAQGDCPYDCGPTQWLKQLEAMVTDPPYEGAPPLRLPTGRLYYLAMQPTRRLDRLHAALKNVNVKIATAEDYIESQAQIIEILSSSLHHVNERYTAPQLAKKLVYEWSKDSLVYDAVSVAQLRRVCADASDGLGDFMDAMPASAVQAVLKVPPPLSPMWYCLSKPITKDPQWIAGHIQELTTAREAFVQKLAFPPKPLQLIDIVADGKWQPPKRKSPAWLLEVREVRQKHAQLENLAHLLEDPVLHIGTLLTATFEVQKQMVAAAVAEEFVVADACRTQIVNIISATTESGKVCTGCFIAIPSNQARQSLLENGMATGNLFVASAI